MGSARLRPLGLRSGERSLRVATGVSASVPDRCRTTVGSCSQARSIAEIDGRSSTTIRGGACIPSGGLRARRAFGLGERGLGLAHRIQSRAPSGAGPTVDLRRSGSQTRRSLTRRLPARAELDGLPHGNAVERSERQKGDFLTSVFPGENPGPRHPGSGSKALLSSIAIAEKSPEARRASSNAHRPGSIPRGPPELRRRLPRLPTLA